MHVTFNVATKLYIEREVVEREGGREGLRERRNGRKEAYIVHHTLALNSEYNDLSARQPPPLLSSASKCSIHYPHL